MRGGAVTATAPPPWRRGDCHVSAIVVSVLLLACASGERAAVPPPPAADAGRDRVRTLACDASFTPARDQLARGRRVDAGALDLVLPARVRPVAEDGGLKLPVLVRPGTGVVELRLRVDRSAGFTASPGGLRRAEPPLPPDAVRRLRLQRCPPVPAGARELPGDPSVAYAAWVAVTRDQCVPAEVRFDGQRRRVRLALGEPCSPPR